MTSSTNFRNRILTVCFLGSILSLSTGQAYSGSNKVPESNLTARMFYPGIHAAPHDFMPVDSLNDSLTCSTPKVNQGRLALVTGGLFGSMIVIHIYQQNGWWKDNRAPFHFEEDLVYGLNVDKVGHFYGAYTLGFVISKCLEWSNVSEASALWYGSAGALLFQTYVEMEDGFSTWGFDRVDFASDVGGAAWPIARYYVPFLRNFDLKFSYHASPMLGSSGGAGFKGQKHLMVDDYEGQTFWMDLKVHDLLPNSLQGYWPGFLCVAVGYAARRVAEPNPYRVYLIGLDLDMTRVIPPNTPFLKTLGQVLNFIHVPLPAVRIVPDGAFFGFYF